MRNIFLFIVIFLTSSTAFCAGQFQPYEIKAGISYYSDEYTTQNITSQLGEEKNIEEVYQNYNYYEAIFDAQERIVIFIAYEKGVIEFSEAYSYDADGNLVKKVVKNSDGSESIVEF
jgi:hypothetical protein